MFKNPLGTGPRSWWLCAVIALVTLAGGCGPTPSSPASALTYDQAKQKLTELASRITVTKAPPGQVDVTRAAVASPADTLPDIATFALPLNPPRDDRSVVAEVFVSVDKSGTGRDGWMVEVGQQFNAARQTLAGGKTAQIAVRWMPSGTGYEYIASGKYRPAGYSPSSTIWADMARAQGAQIDVVTQRLVGDVPGVVMKSAVAERLKAGKPSIDVTDIVNATIQGKLQLGYTNPFASASGLTFLLTVLQTFAHGEESAMLSPAVASALEQFQRSVPFVAMTTPQLRDSVEQDGSLEAFVLGYSIYAQTPSLSSGYVFVPFGQRHDNPLFAVGPLGAEQREVLERFARFAAGPGPQALAARYGFNPTLDWTPPYKDPSGKTAIEAQRLWKQKKNAGRPIAAVFLADVSGSMGGTKIAQLRQALIDGGSFIAPGNAIGLASFSSNVTLQLPIRPFQLLHKAAYQTAAGQLVPGGGTAMYNGIVVALQMLEEYRQANPDARPMLFVLTDGQTNEGLTFDQVQAMIHALGIPVYTIGFDADIKELARLSGLVEAASFNATEADLRYKLSALLNAQM